MKLCWSPVNHQEGYWSPPVEVGIAIPLIDYGKPGQPKSGVRLNLNSLQVDESIFVPLSIASRYRVESLVRNTTYRHRIKYAVRAWIKDGVEGTRIWRI